MELEEGDLGDMLVWNYLDQLLFGQELVHFLQEFLILISDSIINLDSFE